MPLQIVKYAPKDSVIDAVVVEETARVLFGPRPGTVSISASRDESFRYQIRIVCPRWKRGDLREAEVMKTCYTRSLELAVREGCRSILLPLLGHDNSQFTNILFATTAMNAIREFLAEQELEIYLQVGNRGAAWMPEQMRQEVGRFIRRSYRMPEQNFLGDLSDAATTITLPLEATRAPVEMQRPMEKAAKSAARGFHMPMPSLDLPGKAKKPDRMPRDLPAPMAPPMPARPSREEPSCSRTALKFPDLTEMMENADAGFSETLLKLIDATGKKDSEIYNKANVSRQLFSKIRNNPDYKPTKPTALAFAIALELDLAQTRDLIGRAGYALNNNSKFDVIITYFIQKKHYNLFDINAILFEYDQNLLGA